MLFVFAIFFISIKESLTNVETHKLLETHEVPKDSNVILPCESTIIDDKFKTVHWEKKSPDAFLTYLDLKDPKMQLYTQYNLAIDEVLLEDEGFYTCKFLKGTKEDFEYNKELNEFRPSKEIRTQFTYLVHIEGTPFNEADIKFPKQHLVIEAKLHEKIILPCEGINLDFKDLKWKVNTRAGQDFNSAISGRQFPDSRIKIQRGYNLEIQNIQPEDAGNYSCLASESFTNKKLTIASHVLEISDPSHDVCSTAAARLSCGINSECHPYEDEPKCSCRKQYSGQPPHCNSTCNHGEHCPLMTCTSPSCKDLCQKTCPSKDLCMIQNYKFTCMCDQGYEGAIYDKCWVDCGPVSCVALTIGSLVVICVMFLVAIIFLAKIRRSERKKLQEDEMSIKMDSEVDASTT